MKRLRGFRLALVLLGAFAVFWPARFGGVFGYTMVAGDSMEPGMYSGDLALTMRQPSYGPGDPIVFEMPGLEHRYVIHRVVRVDDDGRFVTRGDNRSTEDNWRVSPDSIIGQQMMIIPRCEHRLCQNLSLPVIFGIGLLGLASGLWVYAAVRGAKRSEHAVLPEPGQDPRTSGGIPMAAIVEPAGTGPAIPEAVLDASTAELVALRVDTSRSHDDDTPEAPDQEDTLARYAVRLLSSARAAGAEEIVVVVAGPSPPRDRLAALLGHLDAAGSDAYGLAVELTIADMEEAGVRKEAKRLSSRGAKIVLSGLREGLLGNHRALRRTLNRSRADAVTTDVRDHGIAALCDCLDGTESMIAVGVETPEQLEILHQHGLEWWSGPLCSSDLTPGPGTGTRHPETDAEPLTTRPVLTIQK